MLIIHRSMVYILERISCFVILLSLSPLNPFSLSQLECVYSYANTQIDFGNSIGATRDESVFTDLNSRSESKKKKKSVFSWHRLPTVSLARASIEICWPCFTYFMFLLFLFFFFVSFSIFHFLFSASWRCVFFAFSVHIFRVRFSVIPRS